MSATMKSRWGMLKTSLVALLMTAAASPGQLVAPHAAYVYPAGGRQNSNFDVTIGGQYLEGSSAVYFSGNGLTGTVVEYIRPLSGKEFLLLRDKLKDLLDRKAAAQRTGPVSGTSTTTRPAWTEGDEKTLAEVRKKLANPPNRQGNPAMAERVTLHVTIAAEASPGPRELRLLARSGLTNPLVFCIGQLTEFSEETERGDAVVQNKRTRPFRRAAARAIGSSAKPARSPMTVTLPATINGQILPGGVDRYRFQARKGAGLVAAVQARELIPYLADAVPGWFQATLALYDADGKELAYDDDYQFHPDPVLLFHIPADGEYVIEVKDALYRGREDFVYRVYLGELPFVTNLFPLGGPAGARTAIDLKGWNLTQTHLIHSVRNEKPSMLPISVRRGDLFSNTLPFMLDDLPERFEKEPNNQPASAQAATLPTIVNGRIDRPGDCDCMRFDGHAGDEIVVEIYARRLDSPLDSTLTLIDAAGHQVAFNDDREDKGAGLSTHHADSGLRIKLPADGTYYVQVADAQNKGGPDYAYRLRISPPRPDFELRVTPSSLTMRPGATAPLTIYALRKDGFSGGIDLAMKDAHPGLKISGGHIPPGQERVTITLTVPPTLTDSPINLELEGRAMIEDRAVVRRIVPAEDMMQAFAYRHLVPTQQLLLCISGKGIQRRPTQVVSRLPVRIPAGGSARVRIENPPGGPNGRMQLELADPPDGITLGRISPTRDGAEILVQSDAKKSRPGTQGNLIVTAFVDTASRATQNKASQNKRRMPVGTLPAIPFEVVAR